MRKSRPRKPDTRRERQKAHSAPLGPYANWINVQYGCTEMHVAFAQARPEVTPDGLTWPVTEIARLTLPMETAKVLCFELLHNIASHEALLGPVNLAPQLVPLMPSAGVLHPDTIARLAVLHYELFAPAPTPQPVKPIENSDVGPHVTKH